MHRHNSSVNYPEIEVVDMHTGGEPLRIVQSGYPPIQGETILDKRRYASERLDHLRQFLMFEPRGHKEMYGALLVEPDLAEADIAVLFMHNAGYSTMCGHAVIALGRYAIDQGRVQRQHPTTRVNIECPCGIVRVDVDSKTNEASFVSVPAFAPLLDQTITLGDGRKVSVDIGYGGAFYALIEDRALGLDIEKDTVRALTDGAIAVTHQVQSQLAITHPDSSDLGFLYGTIITDGRLPNKEQTRNICVFADAQVDRSPTGSGVTARMAAAHAKGLVAIEETITFISMVDSRFEARIVKKSMLGSHNAVQVSVGGKAHYTGRSTFIYEADDRLGQGFLCR